MKVKELIDELKNCNPEHEVVIEKQVKSYCGSMPFRKIRNVYQGFDWDFGKVYLMLEKVKLPKYLLRRTKLK
jgi:hypothetical protein